MFVDEPIYAKELQDKAKNILNKYAVGKLLVSGDNRYLCDDLMRLLGYIVKCSVGESEAYKALGDAAALHERIEEKYNPCTDYSVTEKISSELCRRIFGKI